MSWYRQQLEDWLGTLDVKADVVLDIGGAQGEAKDRVKSWDVKSYAVLDLPEFNVERQTTDDNHMFSIISEDYPTEKYLGKADIIFCLEVFEYLIDPFEAMKNIAKMLKGKAYITFAFVYPTHNELELDSTRYTEQGVGRLAKAHDLKVTNTWYRTDKSGLLQSFYSADGMHPAKQYSHHDATGFIVELSR